MSTVKSNRINIARPVYSPVLTDTAEGTTYGPVKTFGKAMQIQLTPQVATGTLYGDGNKEEDVGLLKGMAVVIDVNKVFSEVKAEIMGNTMADGVVIEKNGDQPIEIALGYEVEQMNSTKEQVWLLKGRAQPANQTIQQSTDNVNFSTDSITINFIPRESDGQIRFYADTANSDYSAEQATAFFLTGPTTYPAKPDTP